MTDMLLAERVEVTSRLLSTGAIYETYKAQLTDDMEPRDRRWVEGELARLGGEIEELGCRLLQLDSASHLPPAAGQQ